MDSNNQKVNFPKISRHYPRRDFIEYSLKALGASSLIGLPSSAFGIGQSSNLRAGQSVQDIINLVLKEIPGAPFKETVDTLKSGSPSQLVKGIVTTMFPTIPVIEETARLGANFIIAHEPTFYNHEDRLNFVPNNQTVRQKRELLERNQIAVWRFHDYWHTIKPDGILYGVLKEMGWIPYYQNRKALLEIPEMTLKDMMEMFKTKLKISHLRFIGDTSQPCRRIALMPGAVGGHDQITIVENEKPDSLIVGEVNEWETAEYIRDSRRLGSKTSLVVLGHSSSEEPGMSWLVDWLQPKLPNMPMHHIASGDPFEWI